MAVPMDIKKTNPKLINKLKNNISALNDSKWVEQNQPTKYIKKLWF